MITKKKPTYSDLEKRINELELEIQNEDRFNLLLKASDDMITIHKPGGEYIYYNGPKCYAISPNEVVGKMPSDLFGKGVSNTLMNAFRKVEKTGKSETLEVLLDWLGEKRWYSEYIYPVKNANGEVVELVKVCRDIDKRKIAEQKVESQNKKLHELNNALNDAQELAQVGSWLLNLSSQKSEWSDEMFSIWGFDSKKGAPALDLIIDRVHPEDLGLFNNYLAETINSGTAFDTEFRICVPDGEQKMVRSICKPLFGEDGEVVSIMGATQDITSQKQFEEAQVKYQRIKAIGEMSASIAHDFNNALQQMMGNLEIVKNKNDFSGSTLERLNNIGSIISNVAERVSALQEFGDTKHDNKNAKLIDFNKLIEESLSESRPLWKDGMEKEGLSINLITDYNEIPKVYCSAGDLKSVIYNLIKNSVEAMPEGGDIIIKTGIRDKGIFVTFTDTGVGMNKESQFKIFQPFYSTKGFKLGRGLGMSGVYSTIKKHRGDIVVKSSEISKGTTIEMVLPINHQDEIKMTTINESKNKEVYSVLWVDDDTLLTDSLSELVELTGHKCDVVNSGKEALEYLDKNSCDIVFTDIGMPVMNGWELADLIRDRFGNKIKIVIVSGWSVEEKDKEANNIDFVLQKPFTLEELKQVLLKA